MNYFENTLLNTLRYERKIKKLITFISDILIIWKEVKNEIDSFMCELNSMTAGLKFKEKVGGGKINYLDKHKNNNR